MDQRSLDAAAKSGNFDLLYELIHEDPYVLVKVGDVPFIDTPLHIAAVAGKTEFAMEIMNLEPSFARKLNADGFTPLHLAVEHNHYWLVLELIKIDPSLVRLTGRHGMTPLLIAVSKKNIDLISEFFLACPESIMDANVNRENALHIAVKNDDQREEPIVIKVLMGWILRLCQKEAEGIEKRVLNRGDKDGNTPLHLAAYKSNLPAMKLMFNRSHINVNIENKDGLTVLDIAVLQRRRENNRDDIEEFVKTNRGKSSVSLVKVKTISDVLSSQLTYREWRRTEMIRYYAWISEERINALLVVFTLVMTATYTTVLQPPGGVSDSGENGRKAGSTVMEDANFGWLFLWNNAGFYIAMLSTLRLLSLGQESMTSYWVFFFPLLAAYYISQEVVSPSSTSLRFGRVGSLLVLVIWFLLALFLEFVLSMRGNVHEPKNGLVLEGFTTLDQARGIQNRTAGVAIM